MSEEKRKMSAFEAFKQTQLTFAEAEEKAKQEAGAPKVDRFRTGEDGEYSVRILPLAPSFDEEGNILPMDRKGFEYALHQFFLSIKIPGKKGKTKKINVPVIRTTDKEVGYSVDLIDTYITVAKEMYGAEDPDLIEQLTKSSYEGGIRWNYQHAMMLLDVSSPKERAKGPQIWQCSHSQYKDLYAAIMRLWRQEGGEWCPVTSLTDAYPVNIIRTTENKKTEYTIEIGRRTLDVEEAEVEKLLALPRIPELIYRYSRYQMEATLVFLQQYDEDHDMAVCKEPDFLEAVEKLKGELPADDTSHFDLATAGKTENSEGKVTLESLFIEYDSIVDQGLSERSDEYLDLREKIRQFVEDNQLDVRLSKSKNNLQMLNEIEEALESQASQTSKKEEPEEAPVPAPRRRASKPKDSEPDPELEEGSDDNLAPATEKEDDLAPTPAPRRARRARPGSQAAEEESADAKADSEKSEDPAPAEETEEKPAERRRLHARRMR